jgi:BirA family biotin operon repressor/biotin-[acetyl-CoA-carboxylase] ligase
LAKLKEALLYALEKNRGGTVSGQALADACGVSRTAVWKAAQTLKQEGHVLEAVTNGGYRILSDRLSSAGVLAHWETESPVVVLQEVPSTNGEAMGLAAEGAPHGTLVLAEHQTAGKGRRGKSFFSPQGAGLYMSLLLKPKVPYPVKITVAAAVAVCRVLEQYAKSQPKIKWVNDIYLDGKKAVGILTEAFMDLESFQSQNVVLGIGINLTPPEGGYPEELQPIITCLFPDGQTPAAFSRCRLAGEVAKEVLALCEDLENPALMEEYRARSFLLGKPVRFWDHEIPVDGTAVDINDQGNLLVETDSGLHVLQAGEVSVRKKEG